ncbi:hypothetical protein PUN28_010991 [Cardiocondyla obscurior]|uniref:Uncharacterized protein n=1 Tax=Cardiocondyla obscurior TaxID=286306 RepID=A0AAW2FN53_9HYME
MKSIYHIIMEHETMNIDVFFLYERATAKPRILKIENFTGKVKILKRQKLDERIQFLPWRLILIDESPPRTSETIDESPPRTSENLPKNIGTQAEISSTDTGIQVGILTAETGTQAEIFWRNRATQTEENYPLKNPGDEKWGPILVTLTKPHLSFRERRQGK